MKKAIPWTLAVLFFVAFAASFSELQRMRVRFGEVTRFQVSHRVYYRQFMIRSELAEAKDPILVIGDSITERAKLPAAIDGRQVINGGISGAAVEDFERVADTLIEHRPSFIAIILGANNTAETLRRAYPALLTRLKVIAPHLLVIGVTPQEDGDLKNAEIKAAADREGIRFVEIPLPEGSTLPDHVHLSSAGYQVWIPALVAAISDQASADRDLKLHVKRNETIGRDGVESGSVGAARGNAD